VSRTTSVVAATMSSKIKNLLQDLRKVPEGEIISEAEFNDSLSFLQPWGFTIYRTYYGPGSDRQWDELIQIVTNGTKDAVQSERPQELPMTLP
jgi:hypothetical protein